MTGFDVTEAEVDDFFAAAVELTAEHGPQLEGDLCRYAGVERTRGLVMWLRLTARGRLIGAGLKGGVLTLWRPPIDGEELVSTGRLTYTPAVAVAVVARRDQWDADERDMTATQWADLQAEVDACLEQGEES